MASYARQVGPEGISETEAQSVGESKPANLAAVDWLRRGVALAFIITLFISRKLWLSARDYPFTPIWNRIPQPPYPIDHILFWLMAAALLAVALLPNPHGALKIVFGIAILWAILDQSRWQPYITLYLVLLACLFALPFEKGRGGSNSEVQWALLPARLTLVFTYTYSGLQKFNHRFVMEVFPWLVEPLHRMIHVDISQLPQGWRIALALGAASAEAASGLLLLFPRTRRPAVLFLVGMHAFILLMIGPLGDNWNAVIWPWNIAMTIALWALFWRRDSGEWRIPPLLNRSWWREVRSRNPVRVPAVVFFFGILPIFSFFGQWDSYLSFSLYSGSVCTCEIRIDPEDYPLMPRAVQAATDLSDYSIDNITWSTEALGAMPSPEHRIALSLGRSLARRARHGPVLLQLGDKPNPFTGRRRYRYLWFPIGGGPTREITYDEYIAPR